MAKSNPPAWAQNMLTLLSDQLAVSQQHLQATQAVTVAVHQMQINSLQGSTPQAFGVGPNGGRPLFNGNGTVRPMHGSGAHDIKGSTLRDIRAFAAHKYFEGNNPPGAQGGAGSQFTQGSFFEPDASGGWTEHLAAGGSKQWSANQLSSSDHAIASANTTARQQSVSHRSNLIAGNVGGIVGMMSSHSGMAKSLGVAGAVAIGGNWLAGEVGNQRKANAQYQSILGGSNWSTGFHNRRLEEGFKLGQRFSGGMTGADATEAFRGVSSLGMTGRERDQSLGFISSNYKSMGMSPDKSLDLIAIASKNAAISLTDVKNSLTEIGKAAKSTNQNLATARENFTQLWGALSQSNSSPQGLSIATSISKSITGMGRSMQGFDVTGLAGTDQGHSLQAGMLGMTLGQFEGATRGPGGSIVAGKGMDRAIGVAIGSYASQLGPLIKSLASASNGGITEVLKNPKVFVSTNAQQLFSALPDGGMGLVSSLAAMGVQVTGKDQAMEYLVRQVLGDGHSFEAEATNAQQSMRQDAGAEYTKTFSDRGKAEWDQGMSYGGKITANADGTFTVTGHKGYINSSGTVQTGEAKDPLIDKFLKDNKKAHVKVQTKDGERVVTGEEAVKYFPDQIATGTAVLVDPGSNYGQTVKDAVGGGYAEDNYYSDGGVNTTTSSGKQDTGKDNEKHWIGKDMGQWQKHLDKSGGIGSTVTVIPNAELAKILQFYPSGGNVYIAGQAGAANIVPNPAAGPWGN